MTIFWAVLLRCIQISLQCSDWVKQHFFPVTVHKILQGRIENSWNLVSKGGGFCVSMTKERTNEKIQQAHPLQCFPSKDRLCNLLTLLVETNVKGKLSCGLTTCVRPTSSVYKADEKLLKTNLTSHTGDFTFLGKQEVWKLLKLCLRNLLSDRLVQAKEKI